MTLFEEFVNQDLNAYMGDGCGASDNCWCEYEPPADDDWWDFV